MHCHSSEVRTDEILTFVLCLNVFTGKWKIVDQRPVKTHFSMLQSEKTQHTHEIAKIEKTIEQKQHLQEELRAKQEDVQSQIQAIAEIQQQQQQQEHREQDYVPALEALVSNSLAMPQLIRQESDNSFVAQQIQLQIYNEQAQQHAQYQQEQNQQYHPDNIISPTYEDQQQQQQQQLQLEQERHRQQQLQLQQQQLQLQELERQRRLQIQLQHEMERQRQIQQQKLEEEQRAILAEQERLAREAEEQSRLLQEAEKRAKEREMIRVTDSNVLACLTPKFLFNVWGSFLRKHPSFIGSPELSIRQFVSKIIDFTFIAAHECAFEIQKMKHQRKKRKLQQENEREGLPEDTLEITEMTGKILKRVYPKEKKPDSNIQNVLQKILTDDSHAQEPILASNVGIISSSTSRKASQNYSMFEDSFTF
jgi:hypothetical protein